MYATGEQLAPHRRGDVVPPPSLWRRRSSFTLVEIVVVLLIMTVILTMTVVSLSGGTAGVGLRESAGGVLTTLRYARYYAAVHGCECRVALSPADQCYELMVRPDPAEDRFEPPPGGRVGRLEPRVHFTTISIEPRLPEGHSENTIIFDPTGECDAARIELSDGGRVYTLIVSPHSGLVRLFKGAAHEIANDREDLDG